MRRAYACIARARAATGAAACVQSVAACRRGLEGPRPSSAAPSHGRALSAGRAGAGAHRVTGTHSGPLQQRSWTGWQRTLRAAMWPASGARRGAAARRWRAPPSHATPGAWLLTGCISGSTEWGLVVSQEVFISAGTRFLRGPTEHVPSPRAQYGWFAAIHAGGLPGARAVCRRGRRYTACADVCRHVVWLPPAAALRARSAGFLGNSDYLTEWRG